MALLHQRQCITSLSDVVRPRTATFPLTLAQPESTVDVVVLGIPTARHIRPRRNAGTIGAKRWAVYEGSKSETIFMPTLPPSLDLFSTAAQLEAPGAFRFDDRVERWRLKVDSSVTEWKQKEKIEKLVEVLQEIKKREEEQMEQHQVVDLAGFVASEFMAHKIVTVRAKKASAKVVAVKAPGIQDSEPSSVSRSSSSPRHLMHSRPPSSVVPLAFPAPSLSSTEACLHLPAEAIPHGDESLKRMPSVPTLAYDDDSAEVNSKRQSRVRSLTEMVLRVVLVANKGKPIRESRLSPSEAGSSVKLVDIGEEAPKKKKWKRFSMMVAGKVGM
ncbi:hypothetical protein JCM11641_007982 [Rhodosporidiobolus odoratus]